MKEKVKTYKVIRSYRIIWVMSDGSDEAERRTWPTLEIADGVAKDYAREGVAPSGFYYIKQEELYE